MKSRNHESETLNVPNQNQNRNIRNETNAHFVGPCSLFHSSPALLENLLRLGVLLLALLCLAATQLNACGPYFPNNLLDSGDYAVLAAPSLRFGDELERMHLIQTRWRTVTTTNDSYFQDAAEAEISDLRTALRRSKVRTEEIERIVGAHRVQRERLFKYIGDYESWQSSGTSYRDADGDWHPGAPVGDPPKLPTTALPPGLPEEFADYFEGACGWHNPVNPDKSKSRPAWERLLERPPAERKFKSTWAAYMLGRSWEDEDADRAVKYFQQVRELASHGFSDSLGLAAASLGWEARLRLQQNKFEPAIQLYLEQLAAGDGSAIQSLRMTAEAAFGSPERLATLAGNPRCQKVLTAYLIAQSPPIWEAGSENQDGHAEANQRTSDWLQAVEAAQVQDVESAEKLALAAYQSGLFEEAARWIKRAPGSLLTQWLQAKLLLREGKVSASAAILARLSHSFPIEANGTNPPISLVDNLWMPFSSWCREQHGIGVQVLGELGVLRLNRHQYRESLDALLRSGFWMDAAYVAERVLTLDELKTYVDHNWPRTIPATNEPASDQNDGNITTGRLSQDLRYLLARRLTRSLRGTEAREYYPAEWQPKFDELVVNLDTGWDESQPAPIRANALFASACISRTNGIELLGTEVGPDWFVHGGNFESGVTAEIRTNENFKILPASTDELSRAYAHHADPEVRFHYRYQAAFLAWEAAKFLPNNSDQTAFVLWQAGEWLKNRDPITADGFYKTLVRRCRQTELGAEADRIRWFPELDENGRVIPRVLRPPDLIPEAEPSQSPGEAPEIEPIESPGPEGEGQDTFIQTSASAEGSP